MGRHVDQFRIDGEMRKATAICKERLPRVAVGLVLADRVLDLLAGQRIFELGGENRDAVQEQHEIEALLVLRAVAQLPHDGEQVAGMQSLRLFIEPARRTEIGELEFDPGIPDAVAQYVERAAPLDLRRKAPDKPLPDRGAIVLAEPSPFLRLRREQEIHDIARYQAQCPVVVLGHPPAVSAWRHFTPGLRLLLQACSALGASVRPIPQ